MEAARVNQLNGLKLKNIEGFLSPVAPRLPREQKAGAI